MTTREQLNEMIRRFEGYAHTASISNRTIEETVFHSELAALESILNDLPDETPPTLAEFRESGEWFLLEFNTANTDDAPIVVSCTDGKVSSPDDYEVNVRDISTIARLPRFYPVEGE
jgi:hypothetical protein